MTRVFVNWAAVLLAGATLACGADDERAHDPANTTAQALENRAYIVSLHSDELTVIDLEKLEIIGRVPTGGVANHMAELNRDFTKVFIDSSETHRTIVVDAEKLRVTGQISLGKHPAHLTLSPSGHLAVMNEDDNAVSFIDPEREVEVKRLGGFQRPHFMRFSADGRYGYVANVSGNQLTRVDMAELEIDGTIALDGVSEQDAPEESGFADAQIDGNGMLYAAHAGSGRVLVYDTLSGVKQDELVVGSRPWVVFAEHPFANVRNRHLVPNFGDRTVSMIDAASAAVVAELPGDEEAYGVNYSSLAPNRAFVMNRVRSDVAVVDLEMGHIIKRIAVGGNTETASTTPDGKWIVATVSSANRVVVIDVKTESVVKTFENVGQYPWSVTIPRGQNYCH